MPATRLRRTALEEDVNHLVRQAQQGDKRAFEVVYSLYQRRIVNYCTRVLYNREDGEEVAQEVMLKAWIKLHTYRFDSPFANWLMRIATNECNNCIRKKKMLSTDDPGVQRIIERLGSETDLEDEVTSCVYYQHLIQLVRETAKTAKPPWDALDWSIFHLLYVKNVSQAREVAHRLQTPEGTVKYRIYKRINTVLDQVRKQIEAEDDSI